MKAKTQQAFIPLEQSAIKELCSETRETAISKNQLRKFTVIDLWHIQKGRRNAAVRTVTGL